MSSPREPSRRAIVLYLLRHRISITIRLSYHSAPCSDAAHTSFSAVTPSASAAVYLPFMFIIILHAAFCRQPAHMLPNSACFAPSPILSFTLQYTQRKRVLSFIRYLLFDVAEYSHIPPPLSSSLYALSYYRALIILCQLAARHPCRSITTPSDAAASHIAATQVPGLGI